MRRRRILRPGADTVYHCMSRLVDGLPPLQPQEMKVFYDHVYKLADFSQILVHVLTCMSNHFHGLVEVPAKVKLSNKQLFRALRRRYGRRHPKTLEFLRAWSNPSTGLLDKLRAQYLARMGNLSVFLKELKNWFSKWYNARHERFGTLWAERFKSVIFGDSPKLIRYLATYLILNPVRAGLTGDPAAYPYCSYAAALARPGPERQGLGLILPGETWEQKIKSFQEYLHSVGAVAIKSGQGVIDPALLYEQAVKEGKLSLAESLFVKLSALSEAIALGAEEFVKKVFQDHWQAGCTKRNCAFHPVPGLEEMDGVVSLKKIKHPFQMPAKASPLKPE